MGFDPAACPRDRICPPLGLSPKISVSREELSFARIPSSPPRVTSTCAKA